MRGLTLSRLFPLLRKCSARCYERGFSEKFQFPEIYAWKNQANRPSEASCSKDSSDDIAKTRLPLKAIHHLEQLSLVDFSNEAAIDRLSSAIKFANRLKDVDTTGVKPLFSLMENETLRLRDDEVTEGNDKEAVLRNAKITMEDFFVAPPGNIPLEQSQLYGETKGHSKTETAVDLKKARRKA